MTLIWHMMMRRKMRRQRKKRTSLREREKLYRILLTVDVSLNPEANVGCYLMEIPWWKLIAHRKHDCKYYTRHGHNHNQDNGECEVDPMRFFNHPFRRLNQTPLSIAGPSAVIGSTIYTFWITENQIYCFDADAHDPKWEPLPSPTLSAKYTDTTGLVALRRQLYLSRVTLMDSTSFGVIFSPESESESEKWRDWREPDTGETKLDNRVIIGSLGDSSGRILVTDPLFLSFKTVYDSTKGEWDPHFGSKLSRRQEDVSEIVGNFVNVDEQHTIYWLSSFCYVCSYNWKKDKFAYGPIIGLEGEYFLSGLTEHDITLPLLHLGGDLFCLLWRHYDSAKRITHLHCSIARVIKQSPPYSLAMFVVGCFCDDVSGNLIIKDAFLLTNGTSMEI